MELPIAESWIPYVVVAVIVAAVAFKVWGFIKDYRRKKENKRLAAQMGLAYEARNRALASLASGRPFGHGRKRRAREVVRGSYDGRTIVSFGYSYYTESNNKGKNGRRRRRHHHYVVTAIEMDVTLPLIRMTPEHVGTAIVKAFGARDLEVESHAFNERWKVWTEDERVAHALLAPDMINQLLRPEYERFPLMIENGMVYTYRKGKQDVSRLKPTLAPLHAFLNEIPAFVLKDHGSPSSS